MAKNSGASQRNSTRPGISRASGIPRDVVVAPHASTRPSTAQCGRQPSQRNSITAIRIASADAGNRAEHRDAGEADDRQPELPSLDAIDAPRSAISNSPMRRRDDDGRQRRCGRFLSSVGAASSRTLTAIAPTTPVSCVLAPAASATGVRDELLLIGKPWKNAGREVRDAERRPSPGSDRPACSASPHRCATARSCPRTPPGRPRRPPITIGARSLNEMSGSRECGQPLRQRTEHRQPALDRSNTRDGDGRADDRDQDARARFAIASASGSPPACRRRRASAASWSHPSTTSLGDRRRPSQRPAASGEKPNSFGTWLSITVSAMPFM